MNGVQIFTTISEFGKEFVIFDRPIILKWFEILFGLTRLMLRDFVSRKNMYFKFRTHFRNLENLH